MARAHLEEGLALAQRVGDTESALWATVWLCYLSNLQADRVDAARQAAKAVELGRHFDTGLVTLTMHFCTGLAHLTAARWTDALTVFEEAYRIGHLRCCGRVMSPEILSGLAEAHFRLGNREAANRIAGEAIDFCETSLLMYSPRPWLVQARCLIARGDAERALQALVSAAALIAKTGANAHLAELHEARAAYALAFGGPWTRAEALTAAHRHYAALDAIAQVARLEIVIGGL